VLLVNQHYWPDHASTAQHLTDLAESLVEQGYDVHVICSRGGSRPSAPRRKRFEVHRGVSIHRVGSSSLGRQSTLRRMTDYLSFHFTALTKALGLPRFDLVVTLTTPPLIGLIGLLLRKLRQTRHVFWSMDLHPDASLALGRMNPRKPLVKMLVWLSACLYRNADRVVALGSYMEDRLLAKGVRAQRISIIPVWGRRGESSEDEGRDSTSLRTELGLSNKLIVMYSGNHGLAHSFDEVIEAAVRLKQRDDIAFLFVGDGPRLREVLDAKRLYGLDNVHRIDFVSRERLCQSLTVADAHLVTMRQEMTGICVPSKVYGAMAVARPVLFVGPEHCEVADTVREAECGYTLRPGDVDGLVRAIESMANDRSLVRALGERGLADFVAQYEREACCARWCWMIGELVGHEPTELRIDTNTAKPAQGSSLRQAKVAS
jgi:glycosyltransferase involved in cell wall biosynthesis